MENKQIKLTAEQKSVLLVVMSAVVLMLVLFACSTSVFSSANKTTATPTKRPESYVATAIPSATASATPTIAATVQPTATVAATVRPTAKPTIKPTVKPTVKPTIKPTIKPTPTTTPIPTPSPISATNFGIFVSLADRGEAKFSVVLPQGATLSNPVVDGDYKSMVVNGNSVNSSYELNFFEDFEDYAQRIYKYEKIGNTAFGDIYRVQFYTYEGEVDNDWFYVSESELNLASGQVCENYDGTVSTPCGGSSIELPTTDGNFRDFTIICSVNNNQGLQACDAMVKSMKVISVPPYNY